MSLFNICLEKFESGRRRLGGKKKVRSIIAKYPFGEFVGHPIELS